MTEPRIRDVYEDYRRGRVPFDRVIEAADSYLDRYAQRQASAEQSARTSSTERSEST